MIRLIIISLIFFSLSATSADANWKDDIRGENRAADYEKDDPLNRFSLGIAAYRTTIRISLSGVDDVKFNGHALSMDYSWTNNLAVNAAFFSLESDNNSILSTIQSDGYDLMFNFGTGLAKKGFKAYGGVGLFRDKWTANSNAIGAYTFESVQFGVGLGYSWDNVSLTATVNLRKSGEYEEFMNTYLTASVPGYSAAGDNGHGCVVSSALTLAVRF